ncbi:MAG: hypothetical protein Q9181_001152 [Wetmoreana brouardii]
MGPIILSSADLSLRCAAYTRNSGKTRAEPDLDQTRVPFRERKFNFVYEFLPVTAPFHSPYLAPAYELITEDVRGLSFARHELKIPVYSTEDGRDLRDWDETNLGPELARLITVKSLHWKLATAFEDATHVLDFGPGGAFGAGLLTQMMKYGRSVHIISVTILSGSGASTPIGGKEELLSRSAEHPVIYASHWLSEYGPRVIPGREGLYYLETKLSRLLGLPPLMLQCKAAEMREPIHMLATRGVRFWAEMDELIFSHSPSKRVAVLQSKRHEIIQKLDIDFQKVWFGRTRSGRSADVDEMTYSEDLDRLVELLYVDFQSRWIDASYQGLLAAFIKRTEERFSTESTETLISNPADLMDPRSLITETFKKDSLWQSKNIDAIIDQDADRTCILQGPVAVKYSKTADEPVKAILDGIYNAHLQHLAGKAVVSADRTPLDTNAGLTETGRGHKDTPFSQAIEIHRISRSTNTALHLPKSWLEMLGGGKDSWRRAFFNAKTVTQGSRTVENPMKILFAPAWNIEVAIEHPDEPAKTNVKLRENADGESTVDTVHLKSLTESKIELTIMHHLNALHKPVALNLRLTVTKEEVSEFVRVVASPDEASADGDEPSAVVPMDFAIKAAWKAMVLHLFSVEGNLLDLVHLSNGFRKFPINQPLKVGDVLRSTSCVHAVHKTGSGKTVEIFVTIFKDGEPIMNVKSCFHYRGRPEDDDETFERQSEEAVLLRLGSKQNVALLHSKSWFHLSKPAIDLVDRTLLFRYHSETRQTSKPRSRWSIIQGKVFLRQSTGEENSEIGEIMLGDHSGSQAASNPVTDFLERRGFPLEEARMFENAVSLNTGTKDLTFRAPASNEMYSLVSGDFNPIHTSRAFSTLAGLPGMITHGLYLSSKVRGLVQTLAAEDDEKLFQNFDCSFDDMVLPKDHIQVNCSHAGMISGRKNAKIEAFTAGGRKVLTATAEVEQPTSAYIFAGQGSQIQGMGMELYSQNPVVREIWDRADMTLREHYGFSILDIVRNNPKQLKIHFGGSRGRNIRQNYLRLTVEKPGVGGSRTAHKVMEDIDEATTSYTFSSPQGLLYSTEFAQPTLVLNAQATSAVMRQKGIIDNNCIYAGHSLGEYAALSALAKIISLENLVHLVFYRGLTMQHCVERDETGRSKYSMCAINPRKVIEGFDEAALRQAVQAIHQETGWLLEIVNLNIKDMQHVCAGDLRALDTLISLVKHLGAQGIGEDTVVASAIGPLIQEYADNARSKPQPVDLERTKAAIPLQGIDVPFHSTFLRSGIDSFRTALKVAINEKDIDPRRMVQKYIANLTGKPFGITKEYFQQVAKLTESPELWRILQEVSLSGQLPILSDSR